MQLVIFFRVYIPINLLFNNKSNFYDNDESREYIPNLSINASWGGSKPHYQQYENGVEKFCKELKKYRKENGDNKMRKIKCFTFQCVLSSCISTLAIVTQNFDHERRYMTPNGLKELFLTCANISESIDVGWCINALNINSLSDYEKIFHKNLKCFSFSFGVNSKSCSWTLPDDDNSNGDRELEVGKLEELQMDAAGPYKEYLDLFDKLKLRKNIKRYQLNLTGSCAVRDPHFLDKFLFQDCEKHKLLERVTIEIDNKNGLNKVFDYLIRYKQELFIKKEIKISLNNFKAIELQFRTFDDKMHGWLGSNEIIAIGTTKGRHFNSQWMNV